MFRLLMKARFNVIDGNAFLGTILPKSSIKDQFLRLQIRKLELVPLLALNDHFVPKKHQGTFCFYQKEHRKKKTICSCFSRRDRSKNKKGKGSKKQNVLKGIISQKGKKPKGG